MIAVKGTYRNGRIELSELPDNVRDEAPVIVTFVESDVVALRPHGMSAAEPARLRAALATFAEDWDSPEMDVYDDYDSSS